MDIFDALNYGFIIARDEELQAVITWNGSATFNIWFDYGNGKWVNTDVFTRYPDGDPTLEWALDECNDIFNKVWQGYEAD